MYSWRTLTSSILKAARMRKKKRDPVRLADTAREPVPAEAPVRMQADANGVPVVFETEKDVRIVRGRLDVADELARVVQAHIG